MARVIPFSFLQNAKLSDGRRERSVERERRVRIPAQP
jgi:hypothetical protein